MWKTTQYSLLNPTNNRLEVKKHSSLTQISSNASAVGRKLMNALILIAQDCLFRNSEQRIFYADIGVVKWLIGMTDGSNDTLKKELKKRRDDSIEYNIFEKDKEKEWGTFGFLSEARIISQGKWKPSKVKFEFPDSIWQMVKSPNVFVWINLIMLRGVEGKYAIALYEFAEDYKNVDWFHCPVPKFRQLMWINENQYKIFTMLEKRVLKTWTEEVNKKTDTTIYYNLKRKGRKVEAIKFKIEKKEDESLKLGETKEIREKLAGLGFKEKSIIRLLKSHTPEYLRTNIAVFEKRSQKQEIKNIQGYLMRAFQVDFAKEEREVEEMKEQKKQREEQAQKQAEAEKQKEEDLKISFETERREHVKEWLDNQKYSQVESLKKEFLEEAKKSPFTSRLLATKEFDYHGIQSQRYRFLGNQFLPEELRDFDLYKKMKSKAI